MQSLYFQSLNSLVLICVSSILRLILKKKKIVTTLQKAVCVFFASSCFLKLFLESADIHNFFMQLLYLWQRGRGAPFPTLPLHLKLFKLKKGI